MTEDRVVPDPGASGASSPGGAARGASRERASRQPPDVGAIGWVLHTSIRFFFRTLLWVFCDLRIERNDRVPRDGAALVVANHASFADPVIIGCGMVRRATYLARDSLFRLPAFGWLLRQLDAVPLPREAAAPREALEITLGALAAGRLLILFPEGTRTRDGSIGEFKKGTAWIARKSGVPVVPVRVLGSFDCWPRHRFLPRRFPIRVIYGNPMRYEPEDTAESFLARLHRSVSDLGSDPSGDHGSRGFPPPEPITGTGRASESTARDDPLPG